jgi:hypothetical protein
VTIVQTVSMQDPGVGSDFVARVAGIVLCMSHDYCKDSFHAIFWCVHEPMAGFAVIILCKSRDYCKDSSPCRILVSTVNLWHMLLE